MFAVGDILHIDAPLVEHRKYHICLGQNEHGVTICVFLNSDDRYDDCVSFDTTRFPMLPASKTGRTAVSLSLQPRYTEHQLRLFRARKIGELAKDVAAELLGAAACAKSMTRPEKAHLVGALTSYMSN